MLRGRIAQMSTQIYKKCRKLFRIQYNYKVCLIFDINNLLISYKSKLTSCYNKLNNKNKKHKI
jgi:hypothetical protein